MGEGESALKIVTGEPTRNRTLKRPSLILEGNIRMNLKEIESIRGCGLTLLSIGIIGEPLCLRH